MEESALKQEIQTKKVERRLLDKNFPLCFREYNLQRPQSKQDESTEEEEMNNNGYYERSDEEIRSQGRMDAKDRWWVAEILATDCEKVWIHTGCEDTMQKWYEWLEYMKRKDGEGKNGGDASAQGGEDDQECRRKCWTSA